VSSKKNGFIKYEGNQCSACHGKALSKKFFIGLETIFDVMNI
jgi:hypothetical protein